MDQSETYMHMPSECVLLGFSQFSRNSSSFNASTPEATAFGEADRGGNVASMEGL